MVLSVDLRNSSSNFSNVDTDDSAGEHVFSLETLLFNIFRKPYDIGFCPCGFHEVESKVQLQETVWNSKDMKKKIVRGTCGIFSPLDTEVGGTSMSVESIDG